VKSEIAIVEIENPIRLRKLDGGDGIFFDAKHAHDDRIRVYIYDMLKCAREYLPTGYHFRIVEALRPLSVQIKYWNEYMSKLKARYPNLSADSEELIQMCDVYVANPYGRGSGHQAGAAIDITLVDNENVEYDMGGLVDDFESGTAATDAPGISDGGRKNRGILLDALTRAGFRNYPAEWWHYSFGDALWAELSGSKIAIFGKVAEASA
jgi:D-alanyl-D-alanine dipeptidase